MAFNRLTKTMVPIMTRPCPVCGTPVHTNAYGTNTNTGRTYCSRACILVAVGLPADFDPSEMLSQRIDASLTPEQEQEMWEVLQQVVHTANVKHELGIKKKQKP